MAKIQDNSLVYEKNFKKTDFLGGASEQISKPDSEFRVQINKNKK